jgi:hypothetical protein
MTAPLLSTALALDSYDGVGTETASDSERMLPSEFVTPVSASIPSLALAVTLSFAIDTAAKLTAFLNEI